MKKNFAMFISVILLFISVSALSENVDREEIEKLLPAGGSIHMEFEGFPIGYLPLLSLSTVALECPPVDDALFTDDPDKLLLMSAFRSARWMRPEESEEEEGKEATFYDPFIFLITEERDLKTYYCVITTTSYALCELENGLTILYLTDRDFSQAIVTFKKGEEDQWVCIDMKRAVDAFIPGIECKEVEGYYSGITEEMWEQMSDAGYDAFADKMVLRYLNTYGFNRLMIML